MMHASALAISWRTALLSLVDGHRSPTNQSPDRVVAVLEENDPGDDEREAFHLDDTELANRLVRDRDVVQHRTPLQSHCRSEL